METVPGQGLKAGIVQIVARNVLDYTTRSGKKVVKVIACGGAEVLFRQVVIEESELMGLEGHHGKQIVFGGPQDQVLAYLDKVMQRRFHKVVNALPDVHALGRGRPLVAGKLKARH